MFEKKSFLAATVIFCMFICLNLYAAHSLLVSSPASPKAEISASISNDKEETDFIYKRIPVTVLSQNNQEKTKSQPIKYTIKEGDTLWGISSTYNIDVTSIINLNNLQSPDHLKIGQELTIPPSGSKTSTPGNIKSSGTPKLASRGASLTPSFIGNYPVNGRLSSKFGNRDGEFHKGIDIAASTGTDVYAFADGRVTFSGWDNGGYGYLVILSHGNGYETYYGHNSKLIVKSGQEVTKGQLISKVGDTGDSDGSHCHFEIRRNGVPINPLNLIR